MTHTEQTCESTASGRRCTECSLASRVEDNIEVVGTSTQELGPKNVLASNGLSDVPICDGRAQTFEDWMIKVTDEELSRVRR